MLLTEYKIENNKPIIYEIGRNKDGSKYQNVIRDFEPYFYVLKGNEHLFENDNRVKRIVDNNYKEIYGREVVKVIVKNHFDIRDLSQLSESFEADIDLNNRYAIDKIGDLEKEPIATCFVDIEVCDVSDKPTKGFPKPRQAKLPITAITCYNTILKKMITFCWKKDRKYEVVVDKKHLEKENITYEDTTIYYNNERQMLMDFISYINDTSPDLMSAWNVNFDMAYIVQRIYNIALDYNKLSSFGIVVKQPDYYNKEQDVVSIKGRIIFDLLTAYKKNNFKGLSSFKLDNVAEQEVGEKKVSYDGTLNELYRDNFDRFVDYNKKDVELLVRIDHKRKLIESYDEIRRMARCKFEDLFESTKVWDCLILYYAKQKGIILPSKGYHSKENFTGATVLPPMKGLHEYVSVVDFASLYPSNDRSLNASPETISDIQTESTVNLNIPYLDSSTMELNIPVKSHRAKLLSEFGEFFVENWNIEKQKFNINPYDKFLPFLNYKKIYFNQDKQGLIPEIFEYLGNYRKEIQKKRNEYKYGSEEYDFYERKQYATKVLVNCFHPNTKIMTKEGIKNIKDVKIGDIVYSINPKTLQIEYKPVIAHWREKFNGELSVYENQSFKLRTTPNHKYLVKDRENNIKKVEAKDLLTSQVIPIHKKMEFSTQHDYLYLDELLNFENQQLYIRYNKDLRKVKQEFKNNNINLELKKSNKHYLGKDTHMTEVLKWTKKDIENAEWLGYEFYWKDGYKAAIILPYKIKNYDFSKIVGWFLSEGWLYKGTPKKYENGNSRGVSYKIGISQELYIDDLLKDIRKLIHRFYIGKDGISICSKSLFKFFEQFGKGSFNVYIPQKYMDLLDNQGLYDGLFIGDGRKSDNTYCSASKKLAENFLHLAYRLGYKCHFQKRKYENCYDVKVFKTKNWGIRKHNLSKEEYNGDVYNLTVADNHTVLVGEKHGFMWCGQSGYGIISYKGFRLYKPEIGAAITYLGRCAILWSKRLIEDKGYNVIFSDSVTKDMKILQEDLTYKTIEELWNENTYLPLYRDGKEVKNWKGQKVLCYSKDNGSIFSQPIEIIRHKVDKKIWRLTLSNQDYVEMTEDHSLIDEELNEIKPEIAKNVLYMKKIKNRNIITKNYIEEIYNFMGMILANGSLHLTTKSTQYCQMTLSFEYINEYFDVLQPIFDKYDIKYSKENKKETDIKIYGKSILSELYQLGLTGTSKTKRVPKFMFNETEENISEYLKGYMTGDGTIIIRNGRPIIRGTSVNKEMLEDLRILFAICGITCSIFKESKTNNYNGLDSGTYSYHLVIMNRDVYRDKIGFSCKSKSDRLDLIVQKTKGEFHKRRINKKEIIEYNDYVYDICIPETQNFFANNILVHNTDSLGFHAGNKDTYIENSKEIQSYLNSTYDEFSKGFNINKHYLKLEFEKTFGKVLFGDAKKRYAGKICYYKGKQVEDMLIMGFELVRSDVSIVGKETQKQFFDMLFMEHKQRKELTTWLRQRVKMIRENKFSIEELGMPTPLNKPMNEYTTNLPIIRGVEYSNNELGLDIQVGEKVKLIYVKGNSETDVIAFRELKELPKDIIIDYEKHIDESVTSKCGRIFDAMAWSMSELEYGGNLLDF